jgi:cytoskeletal protein CcmA (bactofilin family)
MLFQRRRTPPIRSLVGEGTVVQGGLRFGDGLRIDGEVRGDVIAARDDEHSILVVSERARITGRVRAAHIIVNGEIQGPVHSSDLLELQPKARICGDVRYEVLEMHPGAQIDGELKPLRAADKPALTLAASNES